ncbi:MAG: tRNA 2-selenouridine(34) synthase MnmH [Bacteroidetes bacterium]|nr:tRNA 2-selenouridine(34) synthase MnmH [Bacteroidota bacterium]
MPTSIDIKEFIKLSEQHPVIDVRTPAEFEQGHIPGAYNIPIFSNEERKIIGTIYKQEGKQPAILKGLELVGPKLHEFIRAANNITNNGILLTHCWRGGMRSASMGWLFESYGFKSITLKGGYKKYRNRVLESFAEPKNIIVVGGRTGSGKTLILHELQNQGEQIVDLEKIAHHKGSSYGSFGEEKQVSQEQFENEVSHAFSKIDTGKICWVEDESRKIGINVLHDDLWAQMRAAKVFCIDLALEERVAYLAEEYGKFTKEELITATQRIGKKLGGQHVKRAVEAIEEGDLKTACEITLVYYDRSYEYGLSQRPTENIIKFKFNKLDPQHIAKAIKLQAHTSTG